MKNILNATLLKKLLPWWLWGIATAFVTFQFTLQNVTGVMVNDLMTAFTIDAKSVGILAGAFFYTYIFLQIPAGLIIDRYGVRKVLTITAIACTLGCYLFAKSEQFWVAEFARILMGTGASFAFVGMLYITNKWFNPMRFALLIGLSESIGMIGTAGGETYLAHAVTNFGWREAMIIMSIVGLVITLLCWFFIRDKKDDNETTIKLPNPLKTFRNVISIPEAWINGLYGGLIFMIVTVFAAVWDIPFLQQAYHLDRNTAALINSLIFVGIGIGCPLYGWYSSRTGQLKKPMIFGAVGALTILSLIIFIPNMPLPLLAFSMFALGLVCSAYLLSFTYAKNLVPKEQHGAMMGLTNMLAMLLAPIFQPLVGRMLMYTDGVTHLSHNAEYSLHAYHMALVILPASILLALVLTVFLRHRISG